MKRLSPVPPCLSLLLLLGPAAGTAQDEPPPLFFERLEVNIVNIEVWVTDKDGHRITGLTQDDFEIYEDGEPVDITNFYAVAREDRILRQVEESLPRAEETARQALPPDQILHLLVLVDHFNSHPVNRNRALKELESFLEDRLAQGDRVMLVGYNRSVKVVEPFTRDRQKVVRGLRKMSKAAAQQPIREAERRRRLRGMSVAAEQGELGLAYEFVRSQVQQDRTELRQTAKSIQDVIRWLAGLPGRKAVLYVSDGLPKRPGEDLYQQLGDLFPLSTLREAVGPGTLVDPSSESMREDESRLFNQIAREANAQRVTFYTLDTKGSRGSSSLSAEYVNLAAGNQGRSRLDAIRTMNLQETMIDIAQSTGGASVFNTFNYQEALVDVAHDFDSFYSLGYPASQGGDGKFHEIEVRVKQPGFKVRHRRGYLDKPQTERIADRTLSSLMLNMEKNPLGIEIDFGRPEKKRRGRFHLPIMVRVPLRNVTLLRNGPVEEGRLRFYLAVKDDEGRVSDLHEHLYPLSVPEDQVEAARQQQIAYATTLKVRAGLPKIAVGVWDEVSGTDSFVHKQVRVGAK